MNRSPVARWALLLFTTLTLSGCLWVPGDGGYHRGNGPDRDRGGHPSERHEGHGGRR